MKTKLTYCLFILILSLKLYSQEETVIINGTIMSNSKIIEDVHIYNITRKLGTVSNDIGKFQLKVSLNDTLYVSSLQYKKMTVSVTSLNIETKELIIELLPIVNKLNEVFLKHLSGSLTADVASQPKDTIPQPGYVYNKKDLYKTLPADSYEKSKRPDAHAITDPLGPLSGGATLPDKRYQAILKQKRELALRKKFPEKLKNEFGIEYFTTDLKIKESQINNFLSYCEFYNIFEKYHNNKVLEVIQILKKESKTYNEIK